MDQKERIVTPTTFVIFGATGDLVRKKIIDSLLRLYCLDYLPDAFQIVGVSRRDYSDDVFRGFLKKNAFQTARGEYDASDIESFLNKVTYVMGDFKDPGLYRRLKKRLEKNDDAGFCDNKLFYLAVPPEFYSVIFNNISHAGLAVSCSPETGWTRVLVEKPFGSDIDTARKLDNMLGKLFREEQIFRIDHYLAKDTIQNILFFRFSNVLFEPAWDNRSISKVEIKLLEDIDIGDRGAFYDPLGALRDVGQNHMLQMLALVAMDNPGIKSSQEIRKKRLEVLKSIKKLDDPSIIKDSVVRGQYRGYRAAEDVPDDSDTETYFRIMLQLDNRKWSGIPFYLESGKALKEKRTEIIIYFKNPQDCICSQEHKKHGHRNILRFRIAPRQSISIRFWAKKPGLSSMLEPRDFEFDYDYHEGRKTKEYDRVLLDCMKGDQTLFASTGEVQHAWDLITPLIDNWGHTRLEIYEKGTDGPHTEISWKEKE